MKLCGRFFSNDVIDFLPVNLHAVVGSKTDPHFITTNIDDHELD